MYSLMGQSRRAFILLSVIWIVVLGGLLAAGTGRMLRMNHVLLRVEKERMALRMASHGAAQGALAALEMDIMEGGVSQSVAEDGNGTENDAEKAGKEVTVDCYGDLWGPVSLREGILKEVEAAWPGVEVYCAVEDEGGMAAPGKIAPELLEEVIRVVRGSRGGAREIARELPEVLVKVKESLGGAGADEVNGFFQEAELYILTLVPGVPRELAEGEDGDYDGILDENESDGTLRDPADDGDRRLEAGLSNCLSFRGMGSVNPNMASIGALMAVPGVSEAIAEEIVDKRNGSDGEAGTEDDFIFRQVEDLKELSSISFFAEFEYSKMAPHIRFQTEVFRISICALSKKSGLIHRIRTTARRDSEKGEVKILSWKEDWGE